VGQDHNQDQSQGHPTEGALEQSDATGRARSKPRLWTDKELELLLKGVQEYGYRWTKIRETFLPHRTIQMLRDRYWRNQAKRTGRFTEQERHLLETAIEMFGEDRDWKLIASQVPGRTATQCQMAWKYGRTHHVQKLDEPWTELDRERLKLAVERFGNKKWTVVSEFVVGKTQAQCRKQWQEILDPTINTSRWSNRELDQLMECVETQMSREEEEESIRIAEANVQRMDDGEKMKDGTAKVFVDPAPRFKGKRKVDWNEVAKGMEGRTSQQCRQRFLNHRKLYRIQGDY
jgi:hypothetical protein